MKRLFLLVTLTLMLSVYAEAQSVRLKAQDKYLNIPVSHSVERARMVINVDGEDVRGFQVRLAEGEPDYWVFCDISQWKGKILEVKYARHSAGLDRIYQADAIVGQDSLYHEMNRPQVHFTQRRGWVNDPNGLVYYDGEYHLFFQHNPYEREWENMSWGHAVSRDLLHWQELPIALHPDHLGTMFSGSAVIDYDNTSGFGVKGKIPMVAIYTANGVNQTQCVAYSLDKGRTWTKYEGNPVIDSKAVWQSHDTRDPKVFWYAPKRHWVMVLNERDGHSIYTSKNLKEWTYRSHTTGFWECPELFELPVDGDNRNTKWVMYGASGTYMIGAFDGEKFTPEAGKFYYVKGNIYAAQTFSNIPADDGRRIQIGWGQINHPNMPINGMMTFPTELTLRTTRNGVRMFCNPISEIANLQTLVGEWDNLTASDANECLKQFSGNDCLRIRATIHLSHATSAGISLCGQNLVDYDMNRNTVNGTFYSPEDMTSMELTMDIIVDRTSVEVFVDNGAFAYVMERHANRNGGYGFWGNNITVKNLEVYTLKSIWE
ncbi:MAG: DUF4980 domain-containing protein [Muribaculaceae bacterium]|nr:DUF4980 domain-containing protein [Muribaculaceae bacterium]